MSKRDHIEVHALCAIRAAEQLHEHYGDEGCEEILKTLARLQTPEFAQAAYERAFVEAFEGALADGQVLADDNTEEYERCKQAIAARERKGQVLQ